ncbi:31 kDa ribonucleoprotein, chloroplastic-like [Bidens hawaiensis]|uniref:31 kDa ribonucleoprotein, chloroplastic-like n=1 Tax=Bidens hawaiensis TaxID=980011 RepID=UPI00404AC8A0
MVYLHNIYTEKLRFTVTAANMSVKEGYCCFVGGLIRSITDRALFETFLRIGYVLDAETRDTLVHIVYKLQVVLDNVSGRSLGYGFVTFATKDSMNNAITEMNGYNLDGSYIVVSKAQPQAGSGRDYRYNGGSRFDLDKIGEWMSMADSNCLLLSNTTWLNNHLREPVGPFYHSSAKSSQSPVVNKSDKEGYRCFVGGLSWSTSDRALFETFLRFGYVIDAEVVLDKVSGRSLGYGFVTFAQRLEMNVEEMNGYNLDGSYITVSKAQPQAGSGRDYRYNGDSQFDLYRNGDRYSGHSRL